MDKKTFLASLEKYDKVRDADFQGDRSRSIPRSELEAKKDTGSGSGVSGGRQQQGRKRMDASTEQILRNSPLFNVLLRKLMESGEVPNAMEHGEVMVNRYRQFLKRLNIEDMEEGLKSCVARSS